MEIKKIVDCFLDGPGNYDSNLLSFKIKVSYQTFFLLQFERLMSVAKEYKMLVENSIPNQKISSGQILKQNFATCHISNQCLYNASDFVSKRFL